MRIGILGFVVGAACLQTRAALPEYPGLALLASFLVCGVLLFFARDSVLYLRTVLAWLSGVTLGFFWAAVMAQAALAPQLAKADEGRDVTLVGTIDSLPYRFEQGVRFSFAVEQVPGSQLKVPPRVALSWYSGFREEVMAVGDVQPGERWQLTVRLQRPHGNANPHGFDYEVWLLEQGLRATGYVRPDKGAARKNQRVDSFVFGFGNLVERSRAGLRERILRSLPGREYAGVIVALVVGDQRAIDHVSLHLSR